MEIKDAYSFCPRCGQKLNLKDGHLQCAACGLNYYLNPKPCTCVVFVNDEGKYLLVKRAFDPGRGLWDLPGGFMELDETFEENVVREVKEELGIEVEIDALHYVTSSFEPYLFQGINHHTVSACFVAKLPKNIKLKPADDVADYDFFDPNSLPSDTYAFKAMSKDLSAATAFLEDHEL